MDSQEHDFKVGDSVRALRRSDFPSGTVVQLLDSGFLLIKWDGELLETAHHSDVTRLRD